MSTFDHVADTNGAELHRLSKLYAFPEFVKKAGLAETTTPPQSTPSVYADPSNKRYPCHSKAATWLSTLFFCEKRAEYHPKVAGWVDTQLRKFAEYWDISGDVEKIRQRYTELYKDAESRLPDSDFAYVWVGEDGSKQRSLRIKNAMECKVAAEWLHKYRDRLVFNDRQKIASKVLEKANRYGADLREHDDYIQKQAGHGVCNPKAVVKMLRQRAQLAKFAAHREGIEKLASQVEQQPRFALTPASLLKLAETVDQIDRSLHLTGKYTDVIRRPEDVIFSATYKEVKAGLTDACATTTGRVYDRDDFRSVKLADVQAAFGSEFAEEVRDGIDGVNPQKMAELAATLPVPDAELFDRVMHEVGVSPISIKAASANTSRGPQELAALADAYAG